MNNSGLPTPPSSSSSSSSSSATSAPKVHPPPPTPTPGPNVSGRNNPSTGSAQELLSRHNLVAEAVKRASVAIVVRDLEEWGM